MYFPPLRLPVVTGLLAVGAGVAVLLSLALGSRSIPFADVLAAGLALARHDQRWLVPMSGLVGSCILLVADTVGRISAKPGELQVGMAIAQQTDVLLLDEPATHLDMAHTVEVLELVARLCRETGRTIVVVLHDLSLAARYSDHLVVVRDGQSIAASAPTSSPTRTTTYRPSCPCTAASGAAGTTGGMRPCRCPSGCGGGSCGSSAW